ncbi:hypothetical protein ACFZAG_01775 [Streptomyces sp. NPDC012403]|uniref:hypothetical protein n=1 Tax=Streptomyces sp. NPDC012403 TaxID=3364831 RepID=UPI0036E081ED
MTHPMPKPVPLKLPVAEEIEYVIRALVASVKEDGAVLEDEEGNVSVHPAVGHLHNLMRCLPGGRIAVRQGDR